MRFGPSKLIARRRHPSPGVTGKDSRQICRGTVKSPGTGNDEAGPEGRNKVSKPTPLKKNDQNINIGKFQSWAIREAVRSTGEDAVNPERLRRERRQVGEVGLKTLSGPEGKIPGRGIPPAGTRL